MSRTSQDRIADTSSLADETLNAIQTVQAFTLEDLNSSRYDAAGELRYERRPSAVFGPEAWARLCSRSSVTCGTRSLGERVRDSVITSYSIHYTKLYETLQPYEVVAEVIPDNSTALAQAPRLFSYNFV